MQDKKKKILYFLLISAISILLVIFGSADLIISKKLYGDFPQFARFFEIFGYLPSCALICGMSAIGFCTNQTTSTPVFKILGYLFFPLFSISGFVFAAYVLCGEIWNANPPFFAVLAIAVLLTAILFFLVNKIPKQRLIVYRKGVIAALFALLLLLLSVELLKNLFGRVRFRDMTEPFSQFTPWYIINGPTSHKSFPSGHTANAAAVLSLTLTAQKKRTRQWLWGLGICYTLVMAISRIIAGAHFASDVLAGGLIGIGCVLLSRKLFHLPS